MKDLKLKTIIAVSLMLISCILMLLMSGMSAFAADDATSTEYIAFSDNYCSGDLCYAGADSFVEWRSLEDSNYYLILYHWSVINAGRSYRSTSRGFYSIDLSDIESIITENDILTIKFKNQTQIYHSNNGNSYDDETGIWTYGTPSWSTQNRTLCYGFEYDYNSKTAYYLNSSYERSSTFWENVVGMETNFPDVKSDSDKLSLSVTFNPTLSGAVDRIVNQNGVSAESNYFSMQITNNSSSNAQFVFAVVPTGSDLNLSSAQINRNTGFDMTAANGVFYYSCKEWVWSPTMAVKNNMSALTLTKYYQSSAWHVVKGNSSYTRSFNWNQLDLEAGVEYDAVVWAVTTDCDIPIRNFSNSLADYYIDLSAGSEVHRSTFNVPNPVAYDSTNQEFGNISNNGIADIVKDGDIAFGYEDKETGETVIEDIYYQDKVDEWADWERVYLEKDVSDFSFSDLTAILSNSRGFFDFLSIVFGWLPSWFWGLIVFGLSSIVVIGIVKAIL